MKGETPIFLFESRFQRWSRAPMSRLQGSGKWSKWGWVANYGVGYGGRH
ncbi:hypothetical protein E1A91_A10G153500v1 [Gossypium mustelinum]|uniref:Uncharacterized protein n=1 Tax=Gossypium mustelinum TaxID=34275 RepID=A0A5D2XM19_GOSMU|nr:hypothetical protein E1A91_A10G153500v1 [Gossypium mustelinum]